MAVDLELRQAGDSILSPEVPSRKPLIVIEPPKRWISLNLGEVWRYRDLLFQLVWRNFSANYRQSLVGVGWALIKPAFSVLIFTIIFGRVAKLPTDGTLYPIFNYSALLPWMYFSAVLTNSSGSVVGGSALLTKVYFPRLILPLTTVLNGLIDFVIQFSLLVFLMAWYRVAPGWGILLLPVLVIQCSIAALAVGLWLCALDVKYRDITHVVPFLAQAWMWITPVVYSSNMVPEGWRTIYGLNPMVGVVEGFRWALLSGSSSDGLSQFSMRLVPLSGAFVGQVSFPLILTSILAVAVLLLSGALYFQRVESLFADVV